MTERVGEREMMGHVRDFPVNESIGLEQLLRNHPHNNNNAVLIAATQIRIAHIHPW